MSHSIAKKLIRLGACGTSVNFKEGNQYPTVVSSIRGKKIKGTIDPLFSSRVSVSNDESGYYVVAIDGIVESVSQIHKILENSKNHNVVILARGFLPDVSNTLAENWIKNKLRTIPFSVTDWGVDAFLNLEKSGFECISSETGGEIRNAKLQNLIMIRILDGKIVYQDQGGVASHLQVSFGKDLGGLKGISIDRTKMLVGLSRFASRSGVTKLSTLRGNIYVPISSFEVGLRAEKSLHNILQNLGCVITSNSESKESTSKEKGRNVKKNRIRRRSLPSSHR
tara:strand:+ start:373 stop:1215 length:843 start_codon:yes stop_codon:yes gene_type:complete